LTSIIRKYYDPAIVETKQESIAELMAKSGVLNRTESFTAEPVEVKDFSIKKEEEGDNQKKVAETTPAVPANEDSVTTEKVKPDSSLLLEKSDSSVKPPIEETKKTDLNWQEVLRNQQPDTVLKELGFDDKMVSFLKDTKELDPKMINFFHHWKENGNINEYLKELNTDYENMTSEEVMRHQLRREYPKASEKALNALYKKEIVEAYKLDPDNYTEEEVEMGKLLLEAKADKFREELVNNQKNFLLPKPPVPKPSEYEEINKIRQKELDEYKSSISNHSYTKEIFANKNISVGEGENKFSFPVDPNSLMDILYDSDKWAESMFEFRENADGSQTLVPNIEHQLLMATMAKYGKSFLNKYAEHFKALGKESAIKSIENASKNTTTIPNSSESMPKNPAEAMAKFGKMSHT